MDQTRLVVPLAIGSGRAALQAMGPLQAAVVGTGPAVAPYAEGTPVPLLAEDRYLPAHLALAIATSGSTGVPRRALLSRQALRASAEATHERLGGPGQWTLALPAHHIAGLQVLVRSIASGWRPTVATSADGFTAEAFAAATRRIDRDAERRYTALVPTQLGRLLEHPAGLAALQSYDAVLLGGAAAPSALLARARDRSVRVVTTYGMSETAGGCVYDGAPLRATSVRIGGDGRISLGGATVADGYLGRSSDDQFSDDQFSDDQFSDDQFSAEDGVRWFRTDDVGHLDADGRLVVDGRVDDQVVTGGLKVAPSLVEEALTTHVPGVVEAVVVGMPDPEWGQAVSAAVVLEGDGRTGARGRPLTVSDLRATLRGILPDHALPRRLLLLAELPLRGPGKPDREAVRDMFANGAS